MAGTLKYSETLKRKCTNRKKNEKADRTVKRTFPVLSFIGQTLSVTVEMPFCSCTEHGLDHAESIT